MVAGPAFNSWPEEEIFAAMSGHDGLEPLTLRMPRPPAMR